MNVCIFAPMTAFDPSLGNEENFSGPSPFGTGKHPDFL